MRRVRNSIDHPKSPNHSKIDYCNSFYSIRPPLKLIVFNLSSTLLLVLSPKSPQFHQTNPGPIPESLQWLKINRILMEIGQVGIWYCYAVHPDDAIFTKFSSAVDLTNCITSDYVGYVRLDGGHSTIVQSSPSPPCFIDFSDRNQPLIN